MSETEAPKAADQKKLDEIVKKDAKTGRTMTGFWYFLCSGSLDCRKRPRSHPW